MQDEIVLDSLEPRAFEHLVNTLAMQVLGKGLTGFGPGPDGGRDGYFEGEAPYPSSRNRWKGKWYIQSKFHRPHLSKNSQKWLLNEIKSELDLFRNPANLRSWPDNWIVATNIDPSGTPQTGAFDAAHRLVRRARPALAKRFHIWGGQKILSLLQSYPLVSQRFYHLLTPGHVLAQLRETLSAQLAAVDTILRVLIVTELEEQQYTRLEQAGSDLDTRPGIHKLYIDLPVAARAFHFQDYALRTLSTTSANSHQLVATIPDNEEWRLWRRHPLRARIWFVRGGPGQGKSTLAQYYCQINRAALLLEGENIPVVPAIRSLAEEVRNSAQAADLWPLAPRCPIYVELKNFAQWFGGREPPQPRGILTYLSERLSLQAEKTVYSGTLERALAQGRWAVIFDGLDEVPSDVKDAVANEVRLFVDEVAIRAGSDLLTVCTSRPQGYSGQFAKLDGPTVELMPLSKEDAIRCAEPVLSLGRTEAEAKRAAETIKQAIESQSVRELMTTPLQAHIMAVVVRDGGRPPERRWQLYNNFYEVIRRREANRNLADPRLSRLLREDEQLLRTLHNRLGFLLHADAETSEGAQTSLSKEEFRRVAQATVSEMLEQGVDEVIETLIEATTDRLVLVSTPDDGQHVRFDIRPLQEFFAAEFVYDSVRANVLRRRLEIIGSDAHWREVTHFLLSALIEKGRATEIAVVSDVLEEMNATVLGDPLRYLARRLCSGGLLAARLLEEGVLEQDRRIRSQFEASLEPLAGVTTTKDFVNLLKIDQPNSSYWLKTILMTRMREADYSENIGAAILLSSILGDGEAEAGEFVFFLEAAPGEYQSVVLTERDRSRFTRYGGRGSEACEWLVRYSLRLVTSDKWKAISGTYSALRLLAVTENLPTIAESEGLSPENVELLLRVLQLDTQHWDRDSSARTELNVPLERSATSRTEIVLLKNDWTSLESTFSEDILKGIAEKPPGLLGVLAAFLRFGVRRNREDFLEILEAGREFVAGPRLPVPDVLAACIPHIPNSEASNDWVKTIRGLSQMEFEQCLERGEIRGDRLRRIRLETTIREPERDSLTDGSYIDELQKLAITAPGIAGHIVTRVFEVLWKESCGTDRGKRAAAEKRLVGLSNWVCTDRDLLGEVAWVWGLILRYAEKNEVDIRSKMIAAACRFDFKEWRWWDPGSAPPETFVINLPKEALFLPMIGNLIASAREDMAHPWYGREEDAPEKERDRVARILGEYLPDGRALVDVSLDLALPLPVRGAAASLGLLHSDVGEALFDEGAREVLLEWAASASQWHEMVVLRFCMLRSCGPKSVWCRRLMDDVLRTVRRRFEISRFVQTILASWREQSVAPVTTSGARDLWLGEAADLES